MVRYCVDSNVVVAWLLQQDVPQVDSFWDSLRGDDELVVPPLLKPECTSVIRVAVFQGWVRHQAARQLIERLVNLPLRVVDSERQFPRALDLAQRFQHKKAYDMQYLAVAEMAQAHLVTLDRGLRHAAREIRVDVSYLR